jgi:3-phenylpropionate/trans-cinnamate dioxygenase ferredoxin reductase component
VAVAKIVAGGQEPFAEVPWFWTDQFDVNLQMAGIHDGCDQLVWRGTCEEPSFTLFHLAQGNLVAATTVNNAREMRFARTLIARGQPVDVTKLADKAINLQALLQ